MLVSILFFSNLIWLLWLFCWTSIERMLQTKSKLDTLRGRRERTHGPLDSLRLVNCLRIFYLPCYHFCCTKYTNLSVLPKTRVQQTHMEFIDWYHFNKTLEHCTTGVGIYFSVRLDTLPLQLGTRIERNNLHSLGQYLALDDSIYLM